MNKHGQRVLSKQEGAAGSSTGAGGAFLAEVLEVDGVGAVTVQQYYLLRA